MEPAVGYASDGFAVSSFHAYVMKLLTEIFTATASAERLFASASREGELVGEGDQLRLPERRARQPDLDPGGPGPAPGAKTEQDQRPVRIAGPGGWKELLAPDRQRRVTSGRPDSELEGDTSRALAGNRLASNEDA